MLDIVYAFVFFGLRRASAERILQSIASGLIGDAAFAGGVATAALGLGLHVSIAIVAAAVFVGARQRLRWIRAQPVLAGILFGVAVYGFMNYVVVPLAPFPGRAPSRWPVVAGLLVAHMFPFGLPISLAAARADAATTPTTRDA